MSSSCSAILGIVEDGLKLVVKLGFGFVAVVSGLLNALVLAVFMKEKALQTFSNAFFVSLVIVDFMAGSVLSTLSVIQISMPITSGICFKKVLAVLLIVLEAVSALTLASLTYDRYCHVKDENSYKRVMSRPRKVLLLLCPWVLPLLLIPIRSANNHIFAWLSHGINVLYYAFLTACYFRLIRILRALEMELNNVTGREDWVVIMRSNQRVLRLIFLNISLFVLCTFLSGIWQVLRTVLLYERSSMTHLEKKGQVMFALTSQLLFQLTAILNPILYIRMHPDLKRAICRIVRRLRARGEVLPANSSDPPRDRS